MKTDHQLKAVVMAELAWDPAINADAIGVGVKDGVVTVSGHIDTYAEKRAIEKALRRIGGVSVIAIELDVKLSGLHKLSDTELAAAIESALKWNAVVPTDKVRVTVANGWVTLSGEMDWEYQCARVERTVRTLIGVTGISDEITLKPRSTPSDVTSRIQDALKRQAEREAKRIQVEVSGATVTLRGSVHSWHERDAAAAAGAAWAAPGMRNVINELRLSV